MVEKKGLDHVLRELSCFDNVIPCKERTCCSNNVENRYCIAYNGKNFCMDYKFKGDFSITCPKGESLVVGSLPNMVAVSNLIKTTKSKILAYS